jgi:hypothetical protein
MLFNGKTACSGRIHIVIVHGLPSHFLMSNNPLLELSMQTNSNVFDDFRVELLPDNHPIKFPFRHLEACCHCHETSLFWAPHCRLISQFMATFNNHMLRRMLDDHILLQEAAATPQQCLGAKWSIWVIRNNASFRAKHPGVSVGSDHPDGTS